MGKRREFLLVLTSVMVPDLRWNEACAETAPARLAMTLEERNEARTAAEALASTFDNALTNSSLLGTVYSSGAPALRARYSREEFLERYRRARASLGELKERRFRGVDGRFDSLPNIIAGQYAIVKFRSTFERASGTQTEEISVQRDLSNPRVWRYVEYYAAPIGGSAKADLQSGNPRSAWDERAPKPQSRLTYRNRLC